MSIYNTMTKATVTQTLTIINELNTKFPLLPLTHLNFSELAKNFKVTKRDFLSMIVFMDWLNQQGKNVSTTDIKSIRVKRNENRWVFLIKSSRYKGVLKFEHNFTFPDEKKML